MFPYLQYDFVFVGLLLWLFIDWVGLVGFLIWVALFIMLWFVVGCFGFAWFVDCLL